MKKILLSFLILGCAAGAFAQSRIGLELGMSNTVFTPGSDHSDYTYKHASNTSPMLNLYYQYKASHRTYVGINVGIEHFSFVYGQKVSDTQQSIIQHKSTYLSFAPTFDVGLGNHQYIHLYFTGDLGFILAGQQTVSNDIYNSIQIGSDQAVGSAIADDNVNHFIFRFGAGIREHIPVSKLWHITFSEGYMVMTNNLTYNGAMGGVHPGMVMFQMGVMRKLHNPVRTGEK